VPASPAVCAEKVAVARAEVGGHLRELAGHQRPAVAIDEKDRAQLRQRLDDPLQALVQARLVPADVVVRHAAHDFVDLRDRPLDGLEHLERMLVQDVERALDPVIGEVALVVVVEPGRECEQHGRKHHRRNHHQLQQPNGRLPGGTHRLSFHASTPATTAICAAQGTASRPWTGPENLASSKHYRFASAQNLSATGRCGRRVGALPDRSPRYPGATPAPDHFAAMLSRVGQGRRSAGTS
jgi:hypothetical protein